MSRFDELQSQINSLSSRMEALERKNTGSDILDPRVEALEGQLRHLSDSVESRLVTLEARYSTIAHPVPIPIPSPSPTEEAEDAEPESTKETGVSKSGQKGRHQGRSR